MKILLTLWIMICFSSFGFAQEVITLWSFNGTSEPEIGEGTASLIGGTIQVDLDGRWRMVGFPHQFENSGTAGAEFFVSTVGYKNIHLTYGHRSSGTQSRWAEVHYTINGGESWEVLGNNDGGLSPHDVIYDFDFDLSDIPGVADNQHFGIRIVSVFSPVAFNPEEPDEEYEANTAYHRARTEGTGGSPYEGGENGGNWRLHNVTFLGDIIDDENGEQDDPELIHFLVFDGNLANNTPFEELAFTYSVNEQAYLFFHSALEGYPFDPEHPNWRKASLERRNAPTALNYRPEGNSNIPYGDADVRGIQVKQPFTGDGGENKILFHLPTNGYEDVVFSFAAMDEGAADMMIIDYSVVEGDPVWIQEGLSQTQYNLLFEQYQLFEISFHDIESVNDNPNFMIRMRFEGDDMEADDGDRVTFNNFALDGLIKTGGVAANLDVVSVNNGETVYVNEEFSILVQALDGENIPAPVEQDVTVTLSIENGSGNLGGTISGIIEEGSTSVLIEGITYSIVESGVVIKAEAEGLEAGFSEAFDVIARTYLLTLQSFPPGAGVLTGSGEYAEETEVTVAAVASDGYAFLNWSINNEVITEDAVFVFTMPDEDVTLTANFDMLGDVLLIHYWHFNNQEIDADQDYLVLSDFSLVGQGEITYPGEGSGYVDFRTHREADPVSNFNLRLGEEPDQGAVLRVRNPSHTRELIIAAPSTGFAEIMVMFATTRTENGNQEQEFYFSPDAGESWTLVEEAYYIPSLPEDEGYVEKIIDLSGYEEVNNNPDLHFKVLFVGEGNDNESGNNRFDNLSVDGRSLDPVNVQDVTDIKPSIMIYPNPARNIFNIEADVADMIVHIYDISGKLVYQQSMAGKSLSIDASAFDAGLYIVRGFSPTQNVNVSKRLLINR